MFTKARSPEYEQTRSRSGFCERVIRCEATEKLVIYKYGRNYFNMNTKEDFKTDFTRKYITKKDRVSKKCGYQ